MAVLVFALSFSIHEAHATTFTTTQSGNWNDPATWGGASPPTIGSTKGMPLVAEYADFTNDSGIFNVVSTVTNVSMTPAQVKLDKSVYTWTDRVNITVTAPFLNLDPSKIETIGNNTLGTITVSTRGHSLSPYSLVETGPNTGIFVGYVILTGDENIKGIGGVDGSGTQPRGSNNGNFPSGTGPTDGFLPAEDSDGLSVTLQTQSQTATASALIRWNVGQVSWLQPNPPSNDQRVLQIIDPDVNLDPNVIDTFLTPVFSNSDLAGVVLNMTETGPRTGIFQGTVHFSKSTSFSNSLHVSGAENTITGEYIDRTLPPPYTPSDQIPINATMAIHSGKIATSQAKVKLDKSVYTWTDRVNIRLTEPDHNLDPSEIDTVNVAVSTRGNSISPYKLVETGPNTGIFTGYVILTGDPRLKGAGGVDGNGKEPTGGGPSGVGPSDGLLPAENSDGISVSFQAQKHAVVATAPIHWNIGKVTWLQSSYPVNGNGTCSIADPDMNLNPMAIDKFFTNVWSDSDSGGIELNMTETGMSTGIFQGIVFFTNSTSSGSHLHVSPGDTVTCEYGDRTLPSPYTPADQLRLTTTTLIATSIQPLEKVTAFNPRIVDSFGNPITGAVNTGQLIQIATDLTNNQNIDQSFAYLVQIKDQNGVTVSLSWITGTLVANQQLTPAQAWTPSASGTFTAQIFVLQSIDNPLQLSKPLAKTIIVQGGTPSNYSRTSVLLSGIVNLPVQGSAATLLIFDPNNNFVQIAQANVASDGKFFTTIEAGGPLFKVNGIYTVKVEYGGIKQSDLSFNCNAIDPISCSITTISG